MHPTSHLSSEPPSMGTCNTCRGGISVVMLQNGHTWVCKHLLVLAVHRPRGAGHVRTPIRLVNLCTTQQCLLLSLTHTSWMRAPANRSTARHHCSGFRPFSVREQRRAPMAVLFTAPPAADAGQCTHLHARSQVVERIAFVDTCKTEEEYTIVGDDSQVMLTATRTCGDLKASAS